MSKIFTKDFRLFFLIFFFSILFTAFIFRTIYPLHFSEQPLFFSELLGLSFRMPFWVIYLSGFIDLLLIWLIAKIFFKGLWRFLPPLILGLSPWFVYSVSSGSFYIYLLCLLLISFLSLFLMKPGNRALALAFFLAASILLLYSSFLIFLIYPFLIFGILLFKLIPFNIIKLMLLIIFVFCLPLFIFMIKNPVGLSNIYHNKITFLSDPGLLNGVNSLQGESRKMELGSLSKMTENKYLYISRYIILKLMKNIMPQTFFTPEEKLLGFSFEPPVYLGLLLPFLYGIYSVMRLKTLKRYFFLLPILAIPSFVSQKMVDLNRLILLEPVVVFVIVYGLIKLKSIKNRLSHLLLLFCFILTFVQFIEAFSDINFREYTRFERFNGILHWRIDKQ